MKKQLKISAAVLAVGLSLNAMADNAQPSTDHKLGSLYLTAQTGLAFLQGTSNVQDMASKFGLSSSKLNLGVGAGIGYAFNVFQSDAGSLSIGPEFNYNYLGYLKFSDDNGDGADINYSEWNLLAKVNYTMMKKYDFFIAGGVAQTPYTISAPKVADHISFKVSPNLTGELQVGAGYHFAKNWIVSVKYAHIFGDSLDKAYDPTNTDLTHTGKNALAFDKVLAGITYKF